MTLSAASSEIREALHAGGIFAGVSVLLGGVGIEPTAQALADHVTALAGRYLIRVAGERLDPLSYDQVRRWTRYYTEERLRTVLRSEQEIAEAVAGYAMIELLHGLDLADGMAS